MDFLYSPRMYFVVVNIMLCHQDLVAVYDQSELVTICIHKQVRIRYLHGIIIIIYSRVNGCMYIYIIPDVKYPSYLYLQ